MRIAAGILMIVAAIIGISFTRGFLGNIPGLLGALPSILLVFVLTFVCVGVYYTLKRKLWGICLAASILSGGILFPLAILPTIFICLRKREWE